MTLTKAEIERLIAATPKPELQQIPKSEASGFYEETESGTFRRLAKGERGRKGPPVKFREVDKWLRESEERKQRFIAWERERTLTTIDEIRLIHLFRQLSKEEQLQLQIEAFKMWEGKERPED